MEILGSTFDDSVFEESRAKVSVALSSYNAKFCEPKWFCQNVTTEEELEEQKVFKFRADLAYNQKDYQKALADYSRCLSLIPKGNVAIRRDVLEGQARCFCYLGQRSRSLDIAGILRKEATNTGHLTCALNLELMIHQQFGEVTQGELALQQLIALHPYNPWQWLRLARCCLTLHCSQSARGATATSGDWGGRLGLNHDHFGNGVCLQQGSREPQGLEVDCAGLDHTCRNPTFAHREEQVAAVSVTDQQNRGQVDVWLKACMCFTRSRLLLRLLRVQQSSFVLQRNDRALQEIEEALRRLSPQEETLQLIAEVMGEDLAADRVKEDSQDGESLAGLCNADFNERWYNRLKSQMDCDGLKMLPGSARSGFR